MSACVRLRLCVCVLVGAMKPGSPLGQGMLTRKSHHSPPSFSSCCCRPRLQTLLLILQTAPVRPALHRHKQTHKQIQTQTQTNQPTTNQYTQTGHAVHGLRLRERVGGRSLRGAQGILIHKLSNYRACVVVSSLFSPLPMGDAACQLWLHRPCQSFTRHRCGRCVFSVHTPPLHHHYHH